VCSPCRVTTPTNGRPQGQQVSICWEVFMPSDYRFLNARSRVRFGHLSPSNKVPGEGQELYRRKQQSIAASEVSLVEIDLTRAGQRNLFAPQYRIPAEYRTTYQVSARRGGQPRRVELSRAPLDRRLPTTRAPLRPPDADVTLDLQSLVDLCYRNGRYDDIDYRAPLQPPLEAADAAWAKSHLALGK
jgi:hypothetical protein